MRAKFKVTKVTTFEGGSQEVNLHAVYSGDKNSEDNQFSQATPSGQLTMHISNPAAIGFLEVGKSYYLDFTPAEK